MDTRLDMPVILLLAADEQFAVLEKRALRDMGVAHFTFMTSGLTVARSLAASPPEVLPDVVICAQKLSDMDGDSFCALLRLHPRLKNLPTLLVLSSDSEVEHCKTLGFNASALLGRPYSTEDLRRLIFSLVAAKAGWSAATLSDDDGEFDKALAETAPPRQERQPGDYYRVGRQSLEEGRWNDAIGAFRQARRDERLKAGAELGLAAAWKNKGDAARYGHSLAIAVDEFIRAGQWERARAVYARLQRENPSAKNPFLARALQALRQDRHEEAAKYLTEGFELTPEAHIRDKTAQICLAAEAPEDMLRKLELALAAVMGERGERLAASVNKEFQKLRHQQEDWRRAAEAERRRKVSLLLEREREDAPDKEEVQNTARCGAPPDTQREANTPALNWRAVTKPLAQADPADKAVADFTGNGDLISIIKYTWKLARGHL
ncbi:MAG: response regulator [Desulfovibrio sp.]|jgi:CheY-like chemotaxis protein|nr:response regulator [Desulfovibrio sp.]